MYLTSETLVETIISYLHRNKDKFEGLKESLPTDLAEKMEVHERLDYELLMNEIEKKCRSTPV